MSWPLAQGTVRRRNPDVEEKRLADTLRQAGVWRDEALHEQNRLRIELAGLEQQICKLAESITTRAAQLAELEPALLQRMNVAGFADEVAFLQACLPRERFDELVWLIPCELKKLKFWLKQDRTALLQMERDKKLTDKTIDQLKEENAAVTIQLSEIQKTLGAIGLRLRQHSEQKQLQQDRLQAVELQKNECPMGMPA
jgi:exonuclease SbcC